MNQFHLSLPIPKRYIPVNDRYSLPVLSLTDWSEFLVRENHWHIVVGLQKPDWKREEQILDKFWALYERQYPQHPIYEKARRGEIKLSRTAPFVCHGDEGRGRKHSAVLVISFHSLLGKGVAVQRKSRTKKAPYLKLWLNYEGHSYTNRFLMAAVGKHLYTNSNTHVFQDLMQFGAVEANNMFTTGVSHPVRGKFWIATLNIVGDWPWLCKAGQLERSFMNVEKHKPNARTNNPSIPKGVCHLCSAGRVGCDFEEIATRSPTWLQTVYADNPFRVPATPWLSLPHQEGESPSLFFFDVFHTFHLGCGKALLGSTLALLAEQRPETNIDDRFKGLSDDYIGWCRVNAKRPYITKLTKETINYPTTRSYPNGGWHKGDLTTTLMKYIEDRFKREDWSGEPMLLLSGQAACAANDCLRILYKGELFLKPAAAKEASELGLRFLRRYCACARIANQNARTLFVLQPKLHAWHHLMLYLYHGSEKGPTLNILAWGTQQSEDFLGRPSRLSRRVTASDKCSDRVIERYLRASYHQWVKAGLIITSR